MSWLRRRAAPSRPADPATSAPAPDTSEFELSFAAIIMLRGSPLLEALAARVPDARAHADATASYALAAAAAMGFDRRGAEAVRETARLHEVGLVYVPTEIATSPPEALGRSERAGLERHHDAGFRLAVGAGIPDRACDWILRAAERFDGGGPEGMAGAAIPLEARIIRAACACARVLVAPAADGAGDRVATAVEALREQAGRELDPNVVEALASMLSRQSG